MESLLSSLGYARAVSFSPFVSGRAAAGTRATNCVRASILLLAFTSACKLILQHSLHLYKAMA